jgi:hypothetical protein
MTREGCQLRFWGIGEEVEGGDVGFGGMKIRSCCRSVLGTRGVCSGDSGAGPSFGKGVHCSSDEEKLSRD